MATTYSPIAIIGMGCRFPGGAHSPVEFWNLLVNGTDAIVDVPKNRWDMRKYYDENTDIPGKLHAKQAGFLQTDIKQFDPLFFGISPREAEVIDPQQRLLLEVCYEAIEDAGIKLERLRGSRTGVFVGGFTLDNMLLQLTPYNRDMINTHTPTSSTMVILSNRISYAFDLRGPSVSMDTACSSSLVAVHYACQSIWNGECDQALTGGVNLMLRPEYPIAMSKGRFLAKHSRSKAFDADAGGYVRGEGAGAVLLKPLEQALKDNDPIYAVVRASGVNQDGQTNGITVPNQQAQETLIREVLHKAHLAPDDIHYVEAHGTGTQAGDPREIEALNAVLCEKTTSDKAFVGSVKTNIGHLEAAAGIAGFMKAALVMHHNQAPQNLHFNTPNPTINFDALSLKVPTQLEPLPEDDISSASINSFGYGGTNAHIILQQWENDKSPATNPADTTSKYALLPITARSEEALRSLANQYAQLLKEQALNFADLQHTLVHRRSHHQFRFAVAGNNTEDIVNSLQAFGDDLFLSAGASYEKDHSITKKKLAFVYTGMGPQWWAMGKQLYESQPIFKAKLQEIDQLFYEIAQFSLLDILLASEEESKITETRYAQPTNLAIQIALTTLWDSWGIMPDAVVGHSVGEVASAYVSGALSLEDALKVSYYRSQLQQECAGTGKMLAVGLSEQDAKELIQQYEDISIAAINSFSSLTLAGDEEGLTKIASILEEQGVFNKMLDVEVPYHSPKMELIKTALLDKLSSLSPQATTIPVYSTVTGESIKGDAIDAQYWWKNVRRPVRFASTITQLLDDGYTVFLEVGPHPVLRNNIKECIQKSGKKAFQLASIRRKENEQLKMLESLGSLFTLGFQPKWEALSLPGQFVKLPLYPWQKSSYWHESAISMEDRTGLKGHVYFNMNARQINPAFEVEFNQYYFPFLNDHQVNDTIVFPGASYVEAGIALHHKIFGTKACTLQKIDFKQMLIKQADAVQVLRFQFIPELQQYTVHSKIKTAGSDWQQHAVGRLLEEPLQKTISQAGLEAIKQICPEEIDTMQLYQTLEKGGLSYGPYFQGMKQLFKGDKKVLTRIEGHSNLSDNQDQYFLHPTILDAAFQSIVAIIEHQGEATPYVPVSIEEVNFYRSPGNQGWSYAQITETHASSIKSDLQIIDDFGNVLVELKGLSCQAIAKDQKPTQENWFYEWDWETFTIEEEPTLTPTGGWIILDGHKGWHQYLRAELSKAELPAILVRKGNTFEQIQEHEFAINPNEIDHFKQLFNTINLDDYTNILYTWPLHPNTTDQLYDATLEQTISISHLAQALAQTRSEETTRLTILTQGTYALNDSDLLEEQSLANGPITGLGALISNEHPNISCQMIDLQSTEEQGSISELVQILKSPPTYLDIALRGGRCLFKTLLPKTLQNQQSQSFETNTDETAVALAIGQAGQVDSLYFREIKRRAPNPDEIEIEVSAAALNFKDLLKVMGQISPKVIEGTYFEAAFGMECAGIVTAVGSNIKDWKVGDEVVAAAPKGCFRSHITITPTYVVPKPSTLSFEEASVLIPYLTTYHGLIDIAQIQEGESILIHNATGGVGMAAIQIAKWKGARIIATAGTPEKKDLLKSIGIEYIAHSRDLAFAKQVMEWTDGKGVDIVINAIAGESLFQSFNVLAPFGRFIEVGKRDIAENTGLPMNNFNKSLTFAAIDIDLMLKLKPAKAQSLLRAIGEAFEAGHFYAMPTQVYEAAQVADAFLLMRQSKHIGKVMLKLKGQPIEARKDISPKAWLDKAGAYLITGGTRGFGLEIAKYMASHGAAQLILVSRSGLKTAAAQQTVAEIEATGTKVIVSATDISQPNAVQLLSTHLKENSIPLKGIVHGAMVLDDGFLLDMTPERYQKVMLPKAKGALNLYQHLASDKLDFFLCFSSISSIVGNVGQANYVAANSFLDHFVHYLRAKGIPGIGINLGVLGDTGVVARDSDIEKVLASSGMYAFSNTEALEGLQQIIRHKPTQISFFNLDWERWMLTQPHAQIPSRFSSIISQQGTGTNISPQLETLIIELSGKDESEQLEYLETEVAKGIAQVLRIPLNQISREKGINQLGIDSLMTVELSNHLMKSLGLEVSNMELISGPSIRQLAKILYSKIDFPDADLSINIDELSEEELDALISKLS
ncbi:MAG: type I polyketide synthase [Chitinophagales bacterium]|nr:type I polyketide synthase [Chitinophagales bacterium]